MSYGNELHARVSIFSRMIVFNVESVEIFFNFSTLPPHCFRFLPHDGWGQEGVGAPPHGGLRPGAHCRHRVRHDHRQCKRPGRGDLTAVFD